MSPVKTIDCHQDVILSMSFNTNGSLLATTCKDRKIRVLDPRAGTVLQVGARLESGLGSGVRGASVAWRRWRPLRTGRGCCSLQDHELWPSLHTGYPRSSDERPKVEERLSDLLTLKAGI